MVASVAMIIDVPIPAPGMLPVGAAARYLLLEGWCSSTLEELLPHLSTALITDGVPLHRANILMPTLHPQLGAFNFVWTGTPEVQSFQRNWADGTGREYLESPIAALRGGTHAVIRRRLCDPACVADFNIVPDLRERGYTDYVICAVGRDHRLAGAISFATKQPGGFLDVQLGTALAVVPYLAPVLHGFVEERIAQSLLEVYLGKDAGRRVLRGNVRRGQGETIHAAVCFSDLRDFTALSDRLPQEDLLELLNAYFDCVVTAVEEQGGEVLKFIGDAVLAIFRVDDDDEGRACRAAIQAARAAFKKATTLNRTRGWRPPIDFGMSVHVGEVVYGNIGGPTRLDFTVIGPTVNVASRIQGLCRPLQRPLLVSEEVKRQSQIACEDVGLHGLKGMSEEVRIFAPMP